MDTPEEQINNGRFHWNVKYRKLENDEGVTIRFFGPVQGETKELARFDCFRQTPHFHIAFYDHDTVTLLDREKPLAVVLEKIELEFNELIAACGSDVPTDQERENHVQSTKNLRGRAIHIDQEFGSVPRSD
ncbi:MAG: hypothetical protein F4219_00405 [Gammaproteobacteria bacterium]|nr:hypothetical protein [Gammaproteobacteria bacterium]